MAPYFNKRTVFDPYFTWEVKDRVADGVGPWGRGKGYDGETLGVIPNGLGGPTGTDAEFMGKGVSPMPDPSDPVPDFLWAACDGASRLLYHDEIPLGAVDGTNRTFTLAHTPIGSMVVRINGVVQRRSTYVLTGNDIVFGAGKQPRMADEIEIGYFY